jgi:sugar O-acyltransferase (sialic acid O-acetyltransferase NeuD family)
VIFIIHLIHINFNFCFILFKVQVMISKNSKNKSSHPRPLVIIGAGGHAVSVLNVALAAGFVIKCFVDKEKKGQNFLGYDIIGHIQELGDVASFDFAIAIGDNAFRERAYSELLLMANNIHFPALVHFSAIIAFNSKIDIGAVIMPNAVIGPNSIIGKFCLVNTMASIDHDCVMSDFSSLAPAAVTGGFVNIGFRSAISIGAIIKDRIKIGSDSVLGANSYLNKNLPDNQVAYGSPARLIRGRNIGDSYLK